MCICEPNLKQTHLVACIEYTWLSRNLRIPITDQAPWEARGHGDETLHWDLHPECPVADATTRVKGVCVCLGVKLMCANITLNVPSFPGWKVASWEAARYSHSRERPCCHGCHFPQEEVGDHQTAATEGRQGTGHHEEAERQGHLWTFWLCQALQNGTFGFTEPC